MIFASFEFLFLFLPVFLVAYYLTPEKWRNITILAFSWAFYAWWRVDFLVLLVGVTVTTYAISRLIASAGIHSRRARLLMIFGVAGNLVVLGYFKYANFGVDTFNQIVQLAGFGPLPWTDIVLPVGLSFYILQSVSYLIDVTRGTVPVSRSFINYAAYKAIFAQLIAGPIVRYAEIADELKHREHSLWQFGEGARIFMIGFAMKAIVADTLGPLVDAAYGTPHPALVDSWIGAIGYCYQLYFDFAGYSTMAIGLARMIGFHFPRNFDDPYLSVSIRDFWQRWHITLSRFLRDYLYISLGGNRHGLARTYANLLTTMAIGGLWHGASWNFVVWGVWHGGLLAVHRWWSACPRPVSIPPIAGSLLTMFVVMLGFVVFRAKTLAGALTLFAGMAGLHGIAMSDAMAWQATPDRLWFLAVAAGLVYLPLLRRRMPSLAGAGLAPSGPMISMLTRVGPLAAFALGMVLLYSREAVPFLYFQF